MRPRGLLPKEQGGHQPYSNPSIVFVKANITRALWHKLSVNFAKRRSFTSGLSGILRGMDEARINVIR